jgi:hypothetical protein
MHGHAAGVIAAVFEALQALDEDGDDVASGNGADDATHEKLLRIEVGWNRRRLVAQLQINIRSSSTEYFTIAD